jgi:hypothetical protein
MPVTQHCASAAILFNHRVSAGVLAKKAKGNPCLGGGGAFLTFIRQPGTGLDPADELPC